MPILNERGHEHVRTTNRFRAQSTVLFFRLVVILSDGKRNNNIVLSSALLPFPTKFLLLCVIDLEDHAVNRRV